MVWFDYGVTNQQITVKWQDLIAMWCYVQKLIRWKKKHKKEWKYDNTNFVDSWLHDEKK